MAKVSGIEIVRKVERPSSKKTRQVNIHISKELYARKQRFGDVDWTSMIRSFLEKTLDQLEAEAAK